MKPIITIEILHAVYNNGLLGYVLRGVNDGLSDSLDNTPAKQTTVEILTLLPEINMDESNRKETEEYLYCIINCVTINAESLLEL